MRGQKPIGHLRSRLEGAAKRGASRARGGLRIPIRRGIALAAVLVATSCAQDTPPPNVILVSIDSLRADHLGAYGYARPTSPNLDRLAREGVLFERAYSVTSWTLPAHLSMLSGLYPGEHGVIGDGTKLAEAVELLPEALRKRGYTSEAVVSGPYLNGRFGLAQGWQTYDDSLAPADDIHRRSDEAAATVSSSEVHERALRALDRLRGRPFFLFLHYFDVHYDYLPPEPWSRRFDPDYDGAVDGRLVATGLLGRPSLPQRDLEHLVALYDGEVGWVDHWIGELVRAIQERGLDRSTLLIVTADHGEEFLEHGRLGHRRNLFDTTLRVPLIVRLPTGAHAGSRVVAPVSTLELARTIAAATGAPSPNGGAGRDLLAHRLGKLRPLASVDLFAELGKVEKALIRDGWKLISRLSSSGELDPGQTFLAALGSDPLERSNLALSDRQFTARLFVALRSATRGFAETQTHHPPASLAAEPHLEEQLRSLGYL